MIDGHMHLEYGDLSVEYVLQFVQQAVKMGLTEIDILDHTHRFREFKPIYEHLRKYPVQDQWLNGRTKFCNSLDEYAELITKVRQLDLPITVKFGLEVCYTEDTEELIREILKGRKYDFLTGAVHSVNSILYDMKFSRELLWDRYSADDIYDWYYQQAISC
ncbi:MAG: histidinol phosphate phosphatase, partial [Erysipelotrichaceae bacterium]|nr:histidinol phosphate phosphatase [Erysipelotrichaceae bacterium]